MRYVVLKRTSDSCVLGAQKVFAVGLGEENNPCLALFGSKPPLTGSLDKLFKERLTKRTEGETVEGPINLEVRDASLNGDVEEGREVGWVVLFPLMCEILEGSFPGQGCHGSLLSMEITKVKAWE